MAEKTCFIRGLVLGPHVSITSWVKFGSYFDVEPIVAVMLEFCCKEGKKKVQWLVDRF